MKLAVISFLAALLFTSCYTSSYYVSPLYGSSNAYRTLPFISDSVRSSLYVNGAVTVGSANQNLHDDVYTFQGNIYNAQQFGRFKAWYGTGLSSGIFTVRKFYYSNAVNPNFDVNFINAHSGDYYFGSYNLNAGAVYCLPMENGSEWRILQFSPSYQSEFGNYEKFRKGLKDSGVAITGLAASHTLLAFALGSELSIKSRKHERFDLGFTYSWIAGTEYKNTEPTYFDEAPPRRYNYFTVSSAYTYKKSTPFIQYSFGHRLVNVQAGFNYCIGSGKK